MNSSQGVKEEFIEGEEYELGLFFFFFFFLVFLPFLGLLLRHMELPRLGV